MSAKQDLFTPVLQAAGDVGAGLTRDARYADEADALQTILREVHRFGSKLDGEAIDRRGALGQELLGQLAERGWFGLTVPEAYGGAGLSLKAATRVVNDLCTYNGSVATCVGLHSGLALHALIHIASPELQQRYLPEIAEGTRIAAFAATEPNAGSDIASMRTTLREQDGKLLLSGTKCYVTNGGICGILTTIGTSPGLGGARSGHTMVVVDPSWPGVSRHGEEHKLGLKGSSTITIDFDDVVIPPDHVLGELSKGLDAAHVALTWGRTFMAAGCLGTARAAFAQALEHTRDRVQFSRPLAGFPLVREQLAVCAANLYAAETVLRLVCECHDTKLMDIALPSTVAKVFVSESAWQVIDRCLQLMGGAGFIEDTGMPRRLRDVRVTRIFEGANDVLRLHLASATLGWPAAQLQSLPKVAASVPACLTHEAQLVDDTCARVCQQLVAIKRKHGFKLFERQCLQSHMADAIIGAYAMMAVVLRTAHHARLDEQGASSVIATARLAVAELAQKAQAALDGMQQAEQPSRGEWVETILQQYQG